MLILLHQFCRIYKLIFCVCDHIIEEIETEINILTTYKYYTIIKTSNETLKTIQYIYKKIKLSIILAILR